MRGLFWVILLAALAVGISLAARYNAGYVLVVVHPYRVELSLNLMLAILLLIIVATYLLVRVVVRALGLPSEVREFREQRRQAQAQRDLFAALRAFLEGRYAKAEKAALELLDAREHSGIAAVIAARAAHELRAFDRRDRYLARAAYYGEDDQTMRVIAQAETALYTRQHQEALAALEPIARKHTAALRLELRAQQLARNWDRYLDILAQLERSGGLEAAQLAELRRYAIGENLARKRRDPKELRDYWQRLAARERQDPKIAAHGARAFLAIGDNAAAQAVLEAAIDVVFDSDLVALYAQCGGRDAVRQIERAERWLAAHPGDAALLLTLGRLCAHERLWGKARSYLEASLSIEESFDAHLALARLLEDIGEPDAARDHDRKALALAEQLLRGAPGRAALPEPRGTTETTSPTA